jgi:hypothetical protein
MLTVLVVSMWLSTPPSISAEALTPPTDRFLQKVMVRKLLDKVRRSRSV